MAAPNHIGLPWLLGSKSDLGALAGPYASFLGGAYDPVWTDFDGVGTRVVPKLSDGQSKEVLDPFGGTTADGRFRLSATSPLEGVPASRFDLRQSLLQQFDQSRSWLNQHPGIGTYDKHQASAYSLLTSGKVRDALDIQREPLETRMKFGLTPAGGGGDAFCLGLLGSVQHLRRQRVGHARESLPAVKGISAAGV